MIKKKYLNILFSKLCSKICELLENLKVRKLEEHDSKAANVYNHIAVISFICMTRFNGYPQIYKPLLEVVQVIKKINVLNKKYI